MTTRQKLEQEHDLLVIMLYEWENRGQYTNGTLRGWGYLILDIDYWGFDFERTFPVLHYFFPLEPLRRISAMKKAINHINKLLYEMDR